MHIRHINVMCFVWMCLHSEFLIKINICQISHLFVGEDEQQSISELFLCQQFGQFTVRLHQPVSVTAVNHKHHRWETTDDPFQSYTLIMLTRAGRYISCDVHDIAYERDIASLVSDLRLCVLNAAPSENRWWRLTANQGAALLTRCACISHAIYRPALMLTVTVYFIMNKVTLKQIVTLCVQIVVFP